MHDAKPDVEDLFPQRRAFLVTHEKRGVSKSLPTRFVPDYEFWSPQTHGVRHAVVIDIDRDDWRASVEDPGLPPYTWAVQTTRGGQVGYLIEDLHERGGYGPLRLFDAVHENLRRLVSGDPDADPLGRCRNPFFSGANVTWKHTERRTLSALYAQLSAVGLWENPRREKRYDATVEMVEGSRNCTLFLWADASKLPADALLDEMTTRALDAGLSAQEARSIWRSVCRRRITGQARVARIQSSDIGFGPSSSAYQAFSDYQARRGRRGGSRNTTKQKDARAKGPTAAAAVRASEASARYAALRVDAAPLLAEGLSQRAVADRLGVPQKTLNRALSDVVESESPLEPQGYSASSRGTGVSNLGGLGGGESVEVCNVPSGVTESLTTDDSTEPVKITLPPCRPPC